MKRRSSLIVVVALMSLPCSSEAATGLRIGGNLWYNADWNLQTCWIDLIHQARNWNWTTVTDQGNANNPWPWPSISYVPPDVINCPKDTDGYPLSVPVSSGGQQYRPVSCVLVEQVVSRYPYGTYTFSCEGTGVVVFAWNHKDTVRANGGVTTKQLVIKPGDITFQRTGGLAAGVLFTIISSSATDHIRNMHLIQPGWTQNYDKQIFNPTFLQMCLPFNPIRTMMWTGSNLGKQHTWADRVRPTSFCQTDSEGVAYEYMMEVANRTHNDLWLSVPPNADSSYFYQLALLVHARLDPSLKCWIEWGNETWWEVAAAKVSGDSGAAHGLDKWSYNGYVSTRLFKVFQDVYGSEMSSRVVKVEAGQCGNSGVGSKIFAVINNPTYNPWGIRPDVYAVAAYFGTGGTLNSDPTGDKQVATANNVLFCTYEGGTAKGRGPAMYSLYSSVLQSLESTFYNFNQFAIADVPDDGGNNWGAYDFIGEPLDTAYKAKALVDYAQQHGWYDTAKTVLNYPMDVATSVMHSSQPTGTSNAGSLKLVFVNGHLCLTGAVPPGSYSIGVFDARGRMVAAKQAVGASVSLDAISLAKGAYFVSVRASGKTYDARFDVD